MWAAALHIREKYQTETYYVFVECVSDSYLRACPVHWAGAFGRWPGGLESDQPQTIEETPIRTHSISCAAFAVLAAGAAQAQSQVIVDGFIDVGLGQVRNASGDQSNTVSEMRNNGNRGTQVRFRGTEDLGSGWQAGFWFEHGFNPQDGSIWTGPARFWQREATLRLKSPMGELRMGRAILPTFQNVWRHEPTGNTGVAQNFKLASTLGSNAQTLFRADNLVQYFLPNLSGLTGSLAWATDNQAPGNAYRGIRLAYGQPKWDVGVEHGITRTGDATPDYVMSTVGASYRFDAFTLMGYVALPKYGAKSQQLSQLGVSVPLTNGRIWGLVGRSRQSGGGTDGDNATNFGVGYEHNLSKRTLAYVSASRIHNEGKAAFRTPGSTNTASALGGSSSAYEIGLRIAF
ncbi:MAG: porin [Ramlibacter sp.]|nr:porin [Ramlibacter sp.]